MTEADWLAIERAPHYHALSEIALSILMRFEPGSDVGIVCGPISTGGLGSLRANEQRFIEAIQVLQEARYLVFDQMVFEERIKELLDPDDGGYDYNILFHFYDPLFRSGVIKQKFFLPQWESSTGACWEHAHAVERGLVIHYLGEDLLPV